MDVGEVKTIQRASIVLNGNFNPAIIHPEWLDRNQLLPPPEVQGVAEIQEKEIEGLEGLKVKFIASNVLVGGIETRLELPSYRIRVTPDKFAVICGVRDKFIELYEFIANTFIILKHTPLSALGMNFTTSLKFSEPASHLRNQYFCGQPDTLSSLF